MDRKRRGCYEESYRPHTEKIFSFLHVCCLLQLTDIPSVFYVYNFDLLSKGSVLLSLILRGYQLTDTCFRHTILAHDHIANLNKVKSIYTDS